jgi:single-stranded-DNA-specific exonuclease
MSPSAWRPDSRTWRIADVWAGADDLARQLNTFPLIAQVLANRGITEADAARSYLNPSLADLHDPELLGGCVEAAGLVAKAVADGKKIVIYGDYDVDGVTGVAILHACLRMAGARPEFYVPHRLDEGYGVNAEAIAKLAGEGTQMLITVDCGISAVGPLSAARKAGMQVVVTDHHTPGEQLPPADAIVHPSLPGGGYPNPHAAGANVAFKLAWQIAREHCGSKRVDDEMRDFLLNSTCLAALGTIADVVPLIGENRSLAVYGLRALPATKHPGLRALIDSAGLADEKLDAYHVGFVLAPRINACGRMGHARLAVELMTDAAPRRCNQIADYLAKQNAERQKVQKQIADEAAEMVREGGLDSPERRSIVLWSDRWHGGIVGIVASRMVDMFNKPAILIAFNGDGCGQGSGRSVPGFHMRDALAACGDKLMSFGGHAMAGGLRVRASQVQPFAEAFEAYAQTAIPPGSLTPTLAIDAETTLGALSYDAVERMSRMSPFGQGNPAPLVAVRGCRVLTPPRRMGRTGETLGMMLAQGSTTMRAVGFGMGVLADLLVGINTVDVAAQPKLNTFNGSTSVELILEDVRWE